jgi:hypothetical protein
LVTNLTAREALGVIVMCFCWVRDMDLRFLQIWFRWPLTVATKCGNYLGWVAKVKPGSWERNPWVHAVTTVNKAGEKSAA